jgi:release factor glutamine methyltransferase
MPNSSGRDGGAPTVQELIDDATYEIEHSTNVALWRRHMARLDAEDLLAEVTGAPVTRRILARRLAPAERARFRRMVRRRVAGEPLPRIVGYITFRGLRVGVGKGVFVPRSSSELMAEEAIRRLRRRRRGRRAVDVGTGAGPVALAIASEVPDADVYGVDISPAAARLAARNARQLRLRNARFMTSDVTAGLPRGLRQSIDVITVHPPYVPRAEVRTLAAEVRSFEPYQSLTDGSVDGLGLVRQLANDGHEWLSDGGWVLVEVSPDHARNVATILRRAGYAEVRSLRDSVGATRVVVGRLTGHLAG